MGMNGVLGFLTPLASLLYSYRKAASYAYTDDQALFELSELLPTKSPCVGESVGGQQRALAPAERPERPGTCQDERAIYSFA